MVTSRGAAFPCSIPCTLQVRIPATWRCRRRLLLPASAYSLRLAAVRSISLQGTIVGLGEDPFIVNIESPEIEFSAWDFTRGSAAR